MTEIAITVTCNRNVKCIFVCVQNSHSLLSGGQVTVKLRSQLKCNHDVELSFLCVCVCVCVEFTFLAQWWSGDFVKLQSQLKVRSRCVCRIHVPCSVVVR